MGLLASGCNCYFSMLLMHAMPEYSQNTCDFTKAFPYKPSPLEIRTIHRAAESGIFQALADGADRRTVGGAEQRGIVLFPESAFDDWAGSFWGDDPF